VKFYRPQQKHAIDIENLPSFAKRRNKVNVDTTETVIDKKAKHLKDIKNLNLLGAVPALTQTPTPAPTPPPAPGAIATIFSLIENYY
jgi:hypothetical protein